MTPNVVTIFFFSFCSTFHPAVVAPIKVAEAVGVASFKFSLVVACTGLRTKHVRMCELHLPRFWTLWACNFFLVTSVRLCMMIIYVDLATFIPVSACLVEVLHQSSVRKIMELKTEFY